jgi:hypothetical protein
VILSMLRMRSSSRGLDREKRSDYGCGWEGPLGLANNAPRYAQYILSRFARKDFQCAPWVVSVHAGSEFYVAPGTCVWKARRIVSTSS